MALTTTVKSAANNMTQPRTLAAKITPPQATDNSVIANQIKAVQTSTPKITPPTGGTSVGPALASQVGTPNISAPTNQPLTSGTRTSLTNQSSTPISAPAIAPNISNYVGGANYRTADASTRQSLADAERTIQDPTKIPAELARTQQVIADMEAQGLDTSAQQKHLARLMGASGATEASSGNSGFDTSWITSGYEDDIAKQIEAYQKRLGTEAYNYNKSLEALRGQKAVDIDAAQQFQNRRGGLYSGGYDYQVGGINSNYAQRNADLEQMYGSNISEIENEIARLKAGAPDEIRRRIDEWSTNQANIYGVNPITGQKTSEQNQRDWENRFAYGNAIGQFGNGQKTIEMQQFEEGKKQNEFNQGVTMADLTGYLPNGQRTTSEEQRQLANLWTVAQQTGTIPDTLADMYGIPRGTRTLDAIAQAENIAMGWAGQALDESKFADSSALGWAGLDWDMMNAGNNQTKSTFTPNQVYSAIEQRYPQFFKPDDYGEVAKPTTADIEAMYRSVINFGLPDDQEDVILRSIGLTDKQINDLDSRLLIPGN